jgi:hypothetical protein
MRFGLTALVLLATAAALVSAGPPIVPDSPFSDGGGLAAKPMKPCVGGIVTRISSTNPKLNVHRIRIEVAGESTVIRVPGFGGEWLACLDKRFKADATKRYDMTIQGISQLGQIIDTIIVKQMTFTKTYVMDGQSNGMLPIGVSKPFAGDLVLTNPDALVAEWMTNNLYGASFMMTTSVGAASFSDTPRNTFASIQVNWTSSDDPKIQSLLINTFGWQFVTGCIEFARKNGPTHCIQIAVATTSIKAHMPNSTYAQSGMISPAPFTSASSELLQAPGGLWNGAKMALARVQPNLYVFVQGEKDFATPGEYAPSLLLLYRSLMGMFDATRAMVGYEKHDDADEETYTQFDDFTLHNYEGHSVTPPSQNPPFNVTALAKRAIKGTPRVCTTRKHDLGVLTARDGGLHHTDTYYIAAIRSAECYDNRVRKASNVVDGPAIKGAIVKAFDTVTGMTMVELTFDQPVQFRLTPRPAAVESKMWTYTQFNNGQFSLGVAQNFVVTASGTPTLTLTFNVERPQFDVPTKIVYTILSDFQRTTITALDSTVNPNPHWPHINPVPADPFTVPLVRASDIVITSTTPTTPTAPLTIPERVPMGGSSSDIDPEWADVVALQTADAT